ncbi:MAG: hypothetical protein IKP68_07315 [Clostridia bacterium]|nr:hypothetical protein [Clostridia bacterium]
MKSFIKAIDELPLIVKIILCIPALDIVWNIYKLCKSIDKGNVFGIVVAVILFFFAPFVWLIDLITLLVKGNVWWFD